MTRFLLTVNEQEARSAVGFDEVFLWSDDASSSFTGGLGPHLTSWGSVRSSNIDFVRIALGVFAADRSTRRRGGGSDWNVRDIALSVQINAPELWHDQRDAFAKLIGFLTGDRWTFEFVSAPMRTQANVEPCDVTYSRAVLLSGGADSAVGALLSALHLPQDTSQALVSHFSSNSISPVQKRVVSAINELAPHQSSIHFQAHLSRRSNRLDGTTFKDEASSRSRSLLFLALGLAIASRADTPLFIPENGFASLNPSLGPERRGALSTHTTHPRFLDNLRMILKSVEAHGAIENPYQSMTKGEMFSLVVNELGPDLASTFLSSTNSCSHTDARYSKAPSGSSCGVCFGCILRRAAFNASGVIDSTTYLCDDQTGRFDSFIKQKSIFVPMRDFASVELKPRKVMAMSLPGDYNPADALAICQRGIEELRGVLD